MRTLCIVFLLLVSFGWAQTRKLHVALFWSAKLSNGSGQICSETGPGNPLFCEWPFESIAKHEAEFNQSLLESGVTNLEIEIVHAQEIVFSDELAQDSNSIGLPESSALLASMAAPTSEFSQLKKKLSVDVVYYMRKNVFGGQPYQGVGGIAYNACLGENGSCDKNRAFGTGAYQFGRPWIFKHEVGHVLGLNHDRNNPFPDHQAGTFEFARGYSIISPIPSPPNPNIRRGTIMSYANPLSGDNTQTFSNPYVYSPLLGGPTGVPVGEPLAAHAALALELIAPLATEMKLTKPDLRETMIRENLAGEGGSQQYFKLEIPGLHQNLTVSLGGGTGDADIFIGRGQYPVIGDGTTYDCSSFGGTNTEECVLYPDWAAPTTYFIMVRGYLSFQGTTLSVEVDAPKKIGKNYPAMNLSGYTDYFMAEIDKNAGNVVFRLTGQNGNYGNADLHVWRFDEAGNRSDCVSQTPGNNELCGFQTGGDFYINVIGASNYGGVSLSVDYSFGPAVGDLTKEIWNGVAGTSVASFQTELDWEIDFSSTSLISQFEGQTNMGDNYGTRIHGYFYPPMSGFYRFHVAGDDHVELWLSSDGEKENANLIAGHTGYTSPRQWNKYASQNSGLVYLLANKKYYISGLHKDGNGGDNFAVAVESDFFPLEILQGHSVEPYRNTPNSPRVAVVGDYSPNPHFVIESRGGGSGNYVIEYTSPAGGVRTINTTSNAFYPDPVPGYHAIQVFEYDLNNMLSSAAFGGAYKTTNLQKGVPLDVQLQQVTGTQYFSINVPEDYRPSSMDIRVQSNETFPAFTRLTVNLGGSGGQLASCQDTEQPFICNKDMLTTDEGREDWKKNGLWFIEVTVHDENLSNFRFTITATWETGTGTPGIPGLYYGSVPGNINTTTPNPNASITTSLGETENSIAGNTTEIYTGMIFDADGNISFTEDMDDKVRLYIDGSLVLSSDIWNDRTSTGNLQLSPGWHGFELRISNGSGGSGPRSSPGFGFDPNGGTNWVHPSDPGNGTLFMVPAEGPVTGVPYSVKYEHSGKCLGVANGSLANAANVEQQTCTGANYQKLTLNQEPGGYYSLRFQHSNQMMDINDNSTANGGSAIQWPYHGNDNQLFELVDHGDGTYSFKYKHSQRCVDVNGASWNDGADVIQWDCHYNDNQRFRFETGQN